MADEIKGAGHNQPPDTELVGFEDRTKAISKTWDAWADAKIDTEALAGRLQEFGEQVRDARKKIDALRKARKEPHLTANREIEASFAPLLGTLDKINTLAKASLTNYAKKVSDEQAEAARLERKRADEAREEAERLRAAAGEDGSLLADTRAEIAEKTAEKTDKSAGRMEKAPVGIKGDRSERAATLKKVWTARIVDQDKAYRMMKK